MRARNLILTAILMAAPGLASATSVIFSDGTFTKKNYVQTPSATSPGATITERTCVVCGDPGRGLLFSVVFPADFGAVDLGVVNTTWSYDPETQGDITSIDASVDKDFTVAPKSKNEFVSTFRPLIEQGGIYYLASIAGGSFSPPVKTTGWDAIGADDLTASDFDEYDFATGTFFTADHPNFDGGTMLFGLAQISSSGLYAGKDSVEYDNLSFTITSQVPEPAVWSMMIFGTAGIGLALRRRARARAFARARK